MTDVDVNVTSFNGSGHMIPVSSLRVPRGKVIRDGYISGPAAEALLKRYFAKIDASSPEERDSIRVALAVSLSAGTSAETDLSQRYLDCEDPDTCLVYLADILTEESSPLAGKTNFLRVFARSLEGFANLTREVITTNKWLARERAQAYEVDPSLAGVCFDYAEALTVSLTTNERRMIAYGLRKKGGEARSMIGGFESGGIPGSDPVSRGVGISVIPDPGRVTGARGSGPYA